MLHSHFQRLAVTKQSEVISKQSFNFLWLDCFILAARNWFEILVTPLTDKHYYHGNPW